MALGKKFLKGVETIGGGVAKGLAASGSVIGQSGGVALRALAGTSVVGAVGGISYGLSYPYLKKAYSSYIQSKVPSYDFRTPNSATQQLNQQAQQETGVGNPFNKESKGGLQGNRLPFNSFSTVNSAEGARVTYNAQIQARLDQQQKIREYAGLTRKDEEKELTKKIGDDDFVDKYNDLLSRQLDYIDEGRERDLLRQEQYNERQEGRLLSGQYATGQYGTTIGASQNTELEALDQRQIDNINTLYDQKRTAAINDSFKFQEDVLRDRQIQARNDSQLFINSVIDKRDNAKSDLNNIVQYIVGELGIDLDEDVVQQLRNIEGFGSLSETEFFGALSAGNNQVGDLMRKGKLPFTYNQSLQNDTKFKTALDFLVRTGLIDKETKELKLKEYNEALKSGDLDAARLIYSELVGLAEGANDASIYQNRGSGGGGGDIVSNLAKQFSN